MNPYPLDASTLAAPPTRAVVVLATTLGQYALIDSGDVGEPLRFAWIETLGGATRTMAAFYLATDAILMRAHFQARENAEVRRLLEGATRA